MWIFTIWFSLYLFIVENLTKYRHIFLNIISKEENEKIPIILHLNVSFCEEIVPVIRILVLFASKPLSLRILFGPPIRISRWIHESVVRS